MTTARLSPQPTGGGTGSILIVLAEANLAMPQLRSQTIEREHERSDQLTRP
jgi:hypothetical protein